VLFSLLAYKPQLAVLVPFALLAGGHWRALFAGAAGLALLLGATTLAFGMEVWPAFAQSMAPAQQNLLAAGLPGFYKMVTVYSSLRMWGAGAAAAWTVQVAGSVAMAVLLVRAWRRPGPAWLKGALLMAATPLATPYALDYDLAILAWPVACVVREAMRDGWRPWEAAVVSLAFVAPGAARVLTYAVALPLTPVAAALLVWIVSRRLAGDGAQPPARGGAVTVKAQHQ
jgi:alpha-1,2-mannosyltransferase